MAKDRIAVFLTFIITLLVSLFSNAIFAQSTASAREPATLATTITLDRHTNSFGRWYVRQDTSYKHAFPWNDTLCERVAVGGISGHACGDPLWKHLPRGTSLTVPLASVVAIAPAGATLPEAIKVDPTPAARVGVLVPSTEPVVTAHERALEAKIAALSSEVAALKTASSPMIPEYAYWLIIIALVIGLLAALVELSIKRRQVNDLMANRVPPTRVAPTIEKETVETRTERTAPAPESTEDGKTEAVRTDSPLVPNVDTLPPLWRTRTTVKETETRDKDGVVKRSTKTETDEVRPVTT